jgi:hypothetical protein
MLGLALLAGDALMNASSHPVRVAAGVCVFVYLSCQLPSTLFVRRWNQEQAHDTAARQNEMAVALRQIRRMHPEGPFFLTDLDSEQFWWGLCYGELYHQGFRELHIQQGTNRFDLPPPEWCRDDDLLVPTETASKMIAEGRAASYSITQSAVSPKP